VRYFRIDLRIASSSSTTRRVTGPSITAHSCAERPRRKAPLLGE
jgi:hypothetical protein